MADKIKAMNNPIKANEPRKSDFGGGQLDLFGSFLCNTEAERGRLSNAFGFWDSVPLYAVSRQQMNKSRELGKFLSSLVVDFQYNQMPCQVKIQPAMIDIPKRDEAGKLQRDQDGEIITVEQSFYPSANEELIEAALRKIATEQNHGFYSDENQTHGVAFSLHQLRKELAARGHEKSCQQIKESLEIMANCRFTITGFGDTLTGKEGGGIFTSYSTVSKKQPSSKDEDNSRWVVYFNPWITKAIKELDYRQFNYAQMMSHTTQLARWLHKRLIIKYTNAAMTQPHKIYYSTIKRDSALLEGYKRSRAGVAAVDAAFKELMESKPLKVSKKTGGQERTVPLFFKLDKAEVLGARGKIEDVVYTVWPNREFVSEVMAANSRQREAVKKIGQKVITRQGQ